MRARLAALAATGLLLLGAAAVPPTAIASAATDQTRPIEADEHQRTIAGLKAPRAGRPVVAIVGATDGTETTDFLVPYGVIARSGVAQVVAVATDDRPLKLMPALTVQADTSMADFDKRHPSGAEYVIVPALHNSGDPAVLASVKRQHAGGAVIVGICSGSKTVAAAGLLSGRRATGHWYDKGYVTKTVPTMTGVNHRRYVVDRSLATTTGVSASLPVSLALVEAIGGRPRAAALADQLGVGHWDARHDSSRYTSRRKLQAKAALNMVQFWNREQVRVPVSTGVDELALALTADA